MGKEQFISLIEALETNNEEQISNFLIENFEFNRGLISRFIPVLQFQMSQHENSSEASKIKALKRVLPNIKKNNK